MNTKTLALLFLALSCSTPKNKTETVRYTPDWPQSSTLAANEMISKYGAPTDWSSTALVWDAPARFKRIIVYRDEIAHHFPADHFDVLEHVVRYSVPADKAQDLIMFDGSISFNRTAQELSVRGNDERSNILALDLAKDIIEGRTSVKTARKEMQNLSVKQAQEEELAE